MNAPRASSLAEHFFRHEHGRLVALLCRSVGMRHVEAVEDAVQGAPLAGLEAWCAGAVPANPSAWLYRVAHNRLIDELRRADRHSLLAQRHARDIAEASDGSTGMQLLADVQDDLLRMLFACCDDSVAPESQLVFALKTLCGFDVREIAQRLFATEAGIYKRLGRARRRLLALEPATGDLGPEAIASRLPAVRSVPCGAAVGAAHARQGACRGRVPRAAGRAGGAAGFRSARRAGRVVPVPGRARGSASTLRPCRSFAAPRDAALAAAPSAADRAVLARRLRDVAAGGSTLRS